MTSHSHGLQLKIQLSWRLEIFPLHITRCRCTQVEKINFPSKLKVVATIFLVKMQNTVDFLLIILSFVTCGELLLYSPNWCRSNHILHIDYLRKLMFTWHCHIWSNKKLTAQINDQKYHLKSRLRALNTVSEVFPQPGK